MMIENFMITIGILWIIALCGVSYIAERTIFGKHIIKENTAIKYILKYVELLILFSIASLLYFIIVPDIFKKLDCAEIILVLSIPAIVFYFGNKVFEFIWFK